MWAPQAQLRAITAETCVNTGKEPALVSERDQGDCPIALKVLRCLLLLLRWEFALVKYINGIVSPLFTARCTFTLPSALERGPPAARIKSASSSFAQVDTPLLLRFSEAPGAILMRRKRRSPMRRMVAREWVLFARRHVWCRS